MGRTNHSLVFPHLSGRWRPWRMTSETGGRTLLKAAPKPPGARSRPGLAHGDSGLVEVNYNSNMLGRKPAYRAINCPTMPNSAVRSGRVRIRQRSRLSRMLPRIIIAAAVGWVLFLAYYIYRETANDDQRAIAECIEEQNRTAVGSSGKEAAAIALMCAHRPDSQ